MLGNRGLTALYWTADVVLAAFAGVGGAAWGNSAAPTFENEETGGTPATSVRPSGAVPSTRTPRSHSRRPCSRVPDMSAVSAESTRAARADSASAGSSPRTASWSPPSARKQ